MTGGLRSRQYDDNKFSAKTYCRSIPPTRLTPSHLPFTREALVPAFTGRLRRKRTAARGVGDAAPYDRTENGPPPRRGWRPRHPGRKQPDDNKFPAQTYNIHPTVVGAIINRPAGSSPITTGFRRIRTIIGLPLGEGQGASKTENRLPEEPVSCYFGKNYFFAATDASNLASIALGEA